MELILPAGANFLKVITKPGSPRDEILSFDEARKAYKVAIAAPPDKGKANLRLVKFISKLTGRRCEIVSGMSSREKLLRLL